MKRTFQKLANVSALVWGRCQASANESGVKPPHSKKPQTVGRGLKNVQTLGSVTRLTTLSPVERHGSFEKAPWVRRRQVNQLDQSFNFAEVCATRLTPYASWLPGPCFSSAWQWSEDQHPLARELSPRPTPTRWRNSHRRTKHSSCFPPGSFGTAGGGKGPVPGIWTTHPLRFCSHRHQ